MAIISLCRANVVRQYSSAKSSEMGSTVAIRPGVRSSR